MLPHTPRRAVTQGGATHALIISVMRRAIGNPAIQASGTWHPPNAVQRLLSPGAMQADGEIVIVRVEERGIQALLRLLQPQARSTLTLAVLMTLTMVFAVALFLPSEILESSFV